MIPNCDREGRSRDGDLNGAGPADDPEGAGCCDHSLRGGPPQRADLATVRVVGVGGAMLLCCAAPTLLSTGLLAVSAGAALGAGAVGVVGVTAVVVGLRRIRHRRIDAHPQSELQGPTPPGGSDVDASDANPPKYLDRSTKRF